MSQYIVKITVTPNGEEHYLQYNNAVEYSDDINGALDFARELAQRAADMRESSDWKENEETA